MGFKKIYQKIMDIFRNKEVTFTENSPNGPSVEVVDNVQNGMVRFKSGTEMSVDEVKKHGHDPLDGMIDQDKTSTQTKRSTASGPKKNNRNDNPYGDEEYGGLKKVGTAKKSGNGTVNENDDAIDDGKPHKARNKTINLSSEINRVERRNKKKQQKINKRSSRNKTRTQQQPVQQSTQPTQTDITKGLKSVDEKQTDTQGPRQEKSVRNPAPKKESKLRSLLKESDNYEDVNFNIPVTIKLPPREAMNHLEEFFDIDLEAELTDMIIERLVEIMEDEGEFKGRLGEQIRNFLDGFTIENVNEG